MEAIKKALGIASPPPELGPYRTIHLNNPEDNAAAEFIDNSIKTSRYTPSNFLFKNLAEQFTRVANFYFLVIVIIASFPSISPVSPWTSLAPLVFVLLVTAVKEASEDYQRHISDGEINSRPVEVVRGGELRKISWIDLAVGDIVRATNKEQVPADLVFLSSSDDQDICFVETSQLDGETNLKVRDALADTATIKTPADAGRVKGRLSSEHPNNSLYTYEGTLHLGGKDVSITIDNLLLRGTEIRNTEWIFGLVVFTGKDTKLIMNSTDAPTKRSKVESSMNLQLYQLFFIQLAVVLVSSITSGVWTHSDRIQAFSFLQLDDESVFTTTFLALFTFIVLYNVMIPISLYVSLELAKAFHARLINSDAQMYYPVNNTPARARTSNLSDELGQVEYIFSDKTGTLTQNQMAFRACFVGGRAYGSASSSEVGEVSQSKAPSSPSAGSPTSVTSMDSVDLNPSFVDPDLDAITDRAFEFADRRLREDMTSGENPLLEEFLIHLSTCHTVIVEAPPDTGEALDAAAEAARAAKIRENPIYQASSPDENALVSAARYLGHKYFLRNPTFVEVDVDGEVKRYKVLNVIEFNSTRKRMSVIVERPDGVIKLFTKGADSVIYERLNREASEHVEETLDQLSVYASIGLRTLVLASRTLSRSEYDEWASKHHEASVSLENREDKLAEVAALMEKDLVLVGATAIEDKLQDGVPETIATLAKGGLKIWVLTGDKQETAINIGFSCRLLTNDQELILLNSEDEESARTALTTAINTYLDANGVRKDAKQNLALVIDGATLAHTLKDDLKMDLLKLGKECQAVVCCRVSPLQKSLVVRLVKDNANAVTLAIGDGANDVSMIQAAEIGVGISGFEGMQAVLASDYAIAQFRYLQRLLLIHGRWSLRRVKVLILYSFYKNVLLALTQFWFQTVSGFSGQTWYDQYLPSMFNAFFTALPIMAFAVLEQDVPATVVTANPQLYMQQGSFKKRFAFFDFSRWVLSGVWQSLVCYWVPTLAFQVPVEASGRMESLFAASTTGYTCVVLTVTVKVILLTQYWTWFTHFVIWGSLAFYAFAIAIYSNVLTLDSTGMYGVGGELMDTPAFWLSIVFATWLCSAPDLAWKYWWRTTAPTPRDIFQELVREGNLTGVVPVEQENPASPIAAAPAKEAPPPLSRTTSAMSIGGRKYTGYAFAGEPNQWDVVTGQRGITKQASLRSMSVTSKQSSASGKQASDLILPGTAAVEAGVEEDKIKGADDEEEEMKGEEESAGLDVSTEPARPASPVEDEED